MPSRPLLLDDRSLVALLVDEGLPITRGAERSTTTYSYFRPCRRVVVGTGSRPSGPFERLDPVRQAVALEQMLALPDEVGLPEPRLTVPVKVDVQRRHRVLNVVNTEAVAAALSSGAMMVLSPPTARDQLPAVLPDEALHSRRSTSRRQERSPNVGEAGSPHIGAHLSPTAAGSAGHSGG